LLILLGAELKAAAEEGLKIGSRILLGDRPIEITFKRTWANLSSYEKLKIFCAIVYVLVMGPTIDAEEVEKLKNGDIMTEMMEEMAQKFPGTLETIVYERDRFLTGSIRDCPGDIVVGVVGLGHLKGIEANWEKEIDRAKLLVIPSKSKGLSLKTMLFGAMAITAVCTAAVLKYFFF